MKTIRKIADEIGVSKQAIEKRLNRTPLKDSIKAHMVKNEKGVKMIDEDGEKLIKSAYSAIDDPIDSSIDMGIDTDIDSVRAAIDALTKQLEVKDGQIAALNQALLNAQQQGQSAQILHAVDKRELLTEGRQDDILPENEKPRSFFSRFFNKLYLC